MRICFYKHHHFLFEGIFPGWLGGTRALWAFSCGSAGKESACSGGDLGLIPGLGTSPGEGKGYLLQYSGLENSMDCIVHGVTKESDMTEWLSLSLTFVYMKSMLHNTKKSPLSSSTIQGWLSCVLSGLFVFAAVVRIWGFICWGGRSLLCYIHYKIFRKKCFISFICGKLLHLYWNKVNHWGS